MKHMILLCLLFSQAVLAETSTLVIQDVGFNAPESVIHDVAHDVYLLSNVNGRAIDNDGNGFISRISPEGKVLQLKWIDGQKPGTTLHAPKGLAISGKVLYVADNGDKDGNAVRLFDLDSGKPLGEIRIPGSYFLNSLVKLPSGDILVSDSGWQLSVTAPAESQPIVPGARRHHDGTTWTPSGLDTIYRITPEHKVDVLARSPELAQPNGINLSAHDGHVLVVSSTSGQLYELDAAGRKHNVRYLPDAGFDGVGQASDGRIFAAGPDKLYALQPDGKVVQVPGIDTHVADLNFDLQRKRLLLPLLRANKLVIQPLAEIR